jgi:hypothetical protein
MFCNTAVCDYTKSITAIIHQQGGTKQVYIRTLAVSWQDLFQIHPQRGYIFFSPFTLIFSLKRQLFREELREKSEERREQKKRQLSVESCRFFC